MDPEFKYHGASTHATADGLRKRMKEHARKLAELQTKVDKHAVDVAEHVRHHEPKVRAIK